MTSRFATATAAYFLRNNVEAFISGLVYTAIYVYFARTLALTPLQLSLVGALHMLTHVIFEVPTGVVADLYSRRASVLIGGALCGASFLLVGAVPLFVAVLVATIVEAVGDTFVSGALDAWLTDEVGVDNMGATILRAEQFGTPWHWAGVGGSVLLATLFNHQVPIMLGGALWLAVTVVLIGLMPETNFTPRVTSAQASMRTMLAPIVEGVRLVRTRRILLILFVAQIFIGAFDSGFFMLNQLHLFTGFTLPTLRLPWLGAVDESAWIALINAANSVLYLGGISLLRRFTNLSDARATPRILLGLFIAIGACVVVFALSPDFGVAVVALCALSTLHTLTEPLLRTWLNQHAPSDVRATVISMSTQVNRLGMMVGNLSIGAVSGLAGLRVALAASALFLVPLLGLLRAQAPSASASASPSRYPLPAGEMD
jgi:DHA3 family tetracycline resistance protein-like MFS transporter